jgi:putative membrane protein
VISRLDLSTLLVSLFLSPQTVVFVLAVAVLGTVLAVFGELSGAAGVIPVVLGFGLTQFRKLAAYYDFTLSTSSTAAAAGLQVRRGLFTLDAQTINLSRVQGVVVTEPFMWRPFGWARLDVSIAGQAAGPDSDGNPSASTVMPVAPRGEVLALARTLLREAGGPDLDEVPLNAPPRRARWVAPVGWRYLAVGVGEHLVVSRSGVLTRRTHVVPHARVQSLQLRQGPWQRRLGLADLRVDSPPGPVLVRARHRDAAEARDLLDRENAFSRLARSAVLPDLRPVDRHRGGQRSAVEVGELPVGGQQAEDEVLPGP